MAETTILLASRSPRRQELLGVLGIPFTTTAADVNEEQITHPDPALNVMETARLKATAVLSTTPSPAADLLLTADTTVILNGRMLNKPADPDAARAMLRSLRGRRHQVYTGFLLQDLASGRIRQDVHTAVVTMRYYDDAEIDAYVASGDPLDKAGAYAIQHPTFRPAARLDGCFTGVMGLSICQILKAWREWGLPLRTDMDAVRAAHQGYPCPLLDTLAVNGG